MKIKLAILDNDEMYLSRFVSVFGTKYSDKFQMYSFTDKDVALATLESAKIEVLIASDVFEIDTSLLPKRCGFAYFVDTNGIETINDQCAICKYQKATLICKQILSIYSENASNIIGSKFDTDTTKLVIFEPVSGGVGSSTMAAACAMYFAAKGKKTLYLNLEKFGMSEVFFSAEGQFDMSDIIFALKSKKTNLAIKLESCVRQAENGVYFYQMSKIALDMLELSMEDMGRLISELCTHGSYDYIVIDMDFSIDREALKLYRKVHSVVWVADGSETSNGKLFRAFHALCTLEQNAEAPIPNRLALVYNKFSNKTGKTLTDLGVKNIGGAPRFEHATISDVLEQLSSMPMFDKIM